MKEKIIIERLEALKQLFPASTLQIVSEEEASHRQKDQETFTVFIGRREEQPIYLMINSPLNEREVGILTLLSDTWRREEAPVGKRKLEEWLRDWLTASLSLPTPLPIPLPLETEMDWKDGYTPLLLWFKGGKREASKELRELSLTYSSRESIICRLDEMKLLILLPQKRLPQDQEEKKEWMMGLYDLLQNELGEGVFLLYHDQVHEPEDLLQKIREIQEIIQILPSLRDRNKAIAPWDVIGEMLAHSLPKEVREKIDTLFTKRGDFSLLREHDWEQVLYVYFRSHLNLSQAAKELYVHRNTLNYRLERIRNETGLDPRNFEEAFLLRLYLLLHPRDEG